MQAVKVTNDIRFLAFLLVVGGVLGVGLAVYMGYKFIQVHWIYSVLVVGFLLLFIWSAVAGVRLWKGEPKGWKWATILFGLQIPILTIPGLRYEFYTGVAVQVLGGNVDKSFVFNLGANADFYLDTRITGLVYGVNLFALVAFVFLLNIRRKFASQSVFENPQ